MLVKLRMWLIRKLIGSYGPYMVPVRDYFLFVDYSQRIWKIKPTYENDYPIRIERWE